ncbi:unnamed protein product [Fusarium equiseti]|uniref:Uncharacterized protein n=1 Tax=Fusarium equiseti TaxID=61235 RepID=A0A8J2IKL5_FUSEQ|nr:unnamed protein product [Fusarium equiseti]
MVPKASLGVFLSLFLNVANGYENTERMQPDHKYAEDRAHMVLNAIHSAGRLWGSALYHNGFGFFPATVPAGALLYHGAERNVTPTGLQWLAFDIEHSEAFAMSRRSKRGKGRHPVDPTLDEHKSDEEEDLREEEEDEDEEEEEFREELRRRSEDGLTKDDETTRYHSAYAADDKDPVNIRGYLHMYQTTRELKLLLLDGMSAGKTRMGTLDTQDLVLREGKGNGRKGDEENRSIDLCKIASEWGLDGFVRMEVGVEIIKCDFSSGLNLVNMMRSEMRDDAMNDEDLSMFQWIRGVGERYDGIGGGRLRIDFSSMVSGLFFPINISSTDPERPDLKRLGAATLTELVDIKAYLKDVLDQPRRFTVDWQGVVDLIVSRYSKRMALMAYEPLPSRHFINEVLGATSTWFNAPPLPDDISLAEQEKTNRTANAIEECRRHYLRPAHVMKDKWSVEDELIYTSLDTVLSTICNTLYLVRGRLLEASTTHLSGLTSKGDGESNEKFEKAVKHGRSMVQQLMSELGWSIWKKPQACAPDELSSIAMWPFGTKEDHWHPGCRSIDAVQNANETYWD